MAHSKQPLNHDENRAKVCFICLQKAKYPITETLVERIKLYFLENYDSSDDRLPSGICGKCRADLSSIACGKKSVDILPGIFDYSVIIPYFSRATRSNPSGKPCECYICLVARQSARNVEHRKLGRPPVVHPEESTSAEAGKFHLLCPTCLSPFARGINHSCNTQTLRVNLKRKCESVDERSKDILVGNIIRQKIEHQPKSRSIQLKTQNRYPLRINVGAGTSSSISSADLSNLQLSIGASNTVMKQKVIPFLRSIGGSKFVESFSERYLQARDRSLNDFFSVASVLFEFSSTEASNETHLQHRNIPVVYCNDLPGLIYHICDERELSADEQEWFKIGIDGGGGFIKVCLTMPNQTTGLSRKVIDRVAEYSGVKKLIILAVVPDVPERYENIKVLLNLLGIHHLPVNAIYAVDMKLGNILGGLQSHSSTFPCLWCEAPKSDFANQMKGKSYPLRSLGSVREYAKNYNTSLQSHPKQTKAAHFKNCVNEPLISGDDQDTFIHKVPPPELHLLLRITNRIFKALQTADNDIALQWLKLLGIEMPRLHSGELNGNMCRKLLQRTDLLIELASEKPTLNVFAESFQRFNEVVSCCFGNCYCVESTEAKINLFFSSFQKLGIPTTSAIHILHAHVPQFCHSNQSGLAQYSEQASETVHTDFQKLWTQCGVSSYNNDNYAKLFLSTVLRYNGRHVK